MQLKDVQSVSMNLKLTPLVARLTSLVMIVMTGNLETSKYSMKSVSMFVA